MKFVSLLLFILIAPVVVFLAVLLLGGFTPDVLKVELAKTNVYSLVSESLKNSEGESSEADPFMGVIQQRLSSSYIQGKTETLLDDSFSWITGKTSAPPVLSFQEIKNDLLAQNPGALEDIKKMAMEAREQQKQMQAENPDMYQESGNSGEQMDMLVSFAEKDFSFPLEKQLVGVKGAYTTMMIALPVLGVLLVLLLCSFLLFCQTDKSRLRWIGTTLLLSGLIGFVYIALNQVVLMALGAVPAEKGNVAAMYVVPILERLFTIYVEKYRFLQMIVGGLFVGAGILCIILSMRQTDAPTVAKTPPKPPIKKKKK